MNGRELYPRQVTKIRQLVRNECCNLFSSYNGESDVCLRSELRCGQLTGDKLICKYFSDMVLPIDQDLYAELVSPDKTKHCAICGKSFLATSNRAQHCADCAKTIKNRKAADRMRNMRDTQYEV